MKNRIINSLLLVMIIIMNFNFAVALQCRDLLTEAAPLSVADLLSIPLPTSVGPAGAPASVMMPVATLAETQLASCKGNCALPQALANAADIEPTALSAEARANMQKALELARRISIERRLNVQDAQQTALQELGLDPKRVLEDCN